MDGRILFMQQRNEKNIYDVIKKMQQLEVNLEQYMEKLVLPMQELSGVADMLENIVVEAEKTGDVEALKMLSYQVLPLYNDLDAVYSNLCGIIEKTVTEQKIGTRLKEAKKKCGSIALITHVVANITANTGDYILGQSTRKIVEHEGQKNIEWNIKHVTELVDESYIAECNRSDGIVIGGGGLFLKDSNPNNLSGWTWPCPTE